MGLMPILFDVIVSRKMHDGGYQNRNTYISASIQDSIKILTAKPTFSGSRNGMALVPIMSDVTEVKNSR